MTDRDALLQAILAEPALDAPRLVFADWLDEHGESAGLPWSVAPPIRAAFIRAQVSAANLEGHGPEARNATALASQLLKPFKAAWSRHLPRPYLGCGFTRGFIEWLNLDVRSFPDVAEAAFACEPIRAIKLTRFQTSGGRESLDPVFEYRRMTRIEELKMSSLGLKDEELRAAFRSDSLGNIKRLGLRHSHLSVKGLAECLESTKLPGLAHLDLAENTQLGNALAACWPALNHRRFKSLDLSRIWLSHHSIAAAVEAPCTDGLEELRFEASPNMPTHGADTAAVIAQARNLYNLRVLDLTGLLIGDDGAKRLATSRHLRNLRVLKLAANGLGTGTVNAFLKDAVWDLSLLNLRFNSVGAADLAALRAKFPNALIEA